MNRTWKDKVWPTAIIAGFAVFIAVNLAFVTMAFRHRPQLVSEHYYQEGYNLRALAERKVQSDAVGWTVTVRHLPRSQADMPLVQLDVQEPGGGPCDSLSGDVGFYRPYNQALDIAALPIHAMGPGKYFVSLPRELEHGAWQALVHVLRGPQSMEKRVNFFAN